MSGKQMNDGVDIVGSWRGCEWGGLGVKKARYPPAFCLLEGGRTWKGLVGWDTMRYIVFLRAQNIQRVCSVNLPHRNWAEKGLDLAVSQSVRRRLVSRSRTGGRAMDEGCSAEDCVRCAALALPTCGDRR